MRSRRGSGRAGKVADRPKLKKETAKKKCSRLSKVTGKGNKSSRHLRQNKSRKRPIKHAPHQSPPRHQRLPLSPPIIICKVCESTPQTGSRWRCKTWLHCSITLGNGGPSWASGRLLLWKTMRTWVKRKRTWTARSNWLHAFWPIIWSFRCRASPLVTLKGNYRAA